MFDELRVLKSLKTVQISESNTIYFDEETLTVRTSVTSFEHYVSVDFSRFSGRLHSILVALADKGLIRNLLGNFEYLQVTAKGWRYFAYLRKRAFVRIIIFIAGVLSTVIAGYVSTLLFH